MKITMRLWPPVLRLVNADYRICKCTAVAETDPVQTCIYSITHERLQFHLVTVLCLVRFARQKL